MNINKLTLMLAYWSLRVPLSSVEVSFVSLGGWGERERKRTGDDGTEMRRTMLNRAFRSCCRPLRAY